MVNDRCVVGICNNDKRYPERYEIHSNVKSGKLCFHKLPVDGKTRKSWIHAVSKGRKHFVVSKHFKICSNHFVDGMPTYENPNPTLFLTYTMNVQCTPEKKQSRPPPKIRTTSIVKPVSSKMIESINSNSDTLTAEELSDLMIVSSDEESLISFKITPYVSGDAVAAELLHISDSPKELLHPPASPKEKDTVNPILSKNKTGYSVKNNIEPTLLSTYIALQFSHITRDSEVSTFTGLQNAKMFQSVFNYVKHKAAVMKYWDGNKRTNRLRKTMSSVESVEQLHLSEDYTICDNLFPMRKSGPKRKISLEQEFLLIMMRLRLGLLIEDLAFRFCISAGTVSQIIITWVILLSKELDSLILWPSRNTIRATMPNCFKQLYPKVRTIIDCSEIFFETSSALDVQACMWSDYKHHATVKFLIAITPNGAISWLSPLYGGRASDIFIVRNSGFLDILEPYDQVMADRGFKIRTDLAYKQCTLCIPPSAVKGIQMSKEEVRETSNIANVRIYVEQAIKRIKHFRILKITQPLLYLPIMNNILRVCAAISNLRKPLVSK
ncbi:uncharacterized protein LOC124806968 [Hydra vulgaris]|uniref:uncharacterized protein LOC124806968 n=2 Tax=Hydra vulgaris TaxID=6087 RepID=UPI001F5FDDD1|nr:uncharacterized protein LOC124806968 [Hydra vulgaris]